MNLTTTILVWAGGEGSGCHGPNCGRKKVGLVKVQDGGEGKSDGFYVRDEKGNKVATVISHRDGDTVVVDWISGKLKDTGTFERLGDFGTVRAVISELKKAYPGATKVAGDRVTGIHHRVGKERTAVAWEA